MLQGDSPSKQISIQTKPARKVKQLTFLEQLIPLDVDSLLGCNHPFKTELEQAEEKAEQETRAEIWNKFLFTFDNSDDLESNTGSIDCVLDGPPVLEKVEPVIPTVSCNGTPPMPEIQDKKQRRKSVPKLEKSSDKRSRERQRRRISAQQSTDNNDEYVVKHIKSVAGGNYYCCHDKFGYGRGFSVMGRRLDCEERVEYMVKWD